MRSVSTTAPSHQLEARALATVSIILFVVASMWWLVAFPDCKPPLLSVVKDTVAGQHCALIYDETTRSRRNDELLDCFPTWQAAAGFSASINSNRIAEHNACMGRRNDHAAFGPVRRWVAQHLPKPL